MLKGQRLQIFLSIWKDQNATYQNGEDCERDRFGSELMGAG